MCSFISEPVRAMRKSRPTSNWPSVSSQKALTSGMPHARASKGRLRVLAGPLALERYAFVLPLGRDELKRVLDRALGELEREGQVRALQVQFRVERGEDGPVETPGAKPEAARR